jgi:plasmid stabilization system protein ParE
MPYIIAVTAGAEEDIVHAYNWYEDQREGIGEQFLKELELYYKKLEQQPTAFGKVSKNYRQVVLKQFPYIIVFELTKTDVVIYAVSHRSRNPKNKLGRKKFFFPRESRLPIKQTDSGEIIFILKLASSFAVYFIIL